MSGFPGAINQVSRKSDTSEPAERLFKPGCELVFHADHFRECEEDIVPCADPAYATLGSVETVRVDIEAQSNALGAWLVLFENA